MASKRNHSKRQNASPALTDLESLVITKRTRTDNIDLTEPERELLKDPDWITEDEAEAIVAERIYRREGNKTRPLREYLKQRGVRVEG